MSVSVVLKSIFDDKGIKKAEKAFDGFGSTVAKTATLIGSVLGGAAVANFGKNAVNAASAFFAEFEGVNQIFGAGASSVQEFADQAARLVGISETGALQAAKQFGVFASSAGLSGQAAASFSVDLVKAAGDLASFNDVPIEETLGAIRSGLQGQGQPLSRFGILMNEATLKQKAFEEGIISTTKEALTPQQRVLAANALILEELGVAQNDFVNYADTYGNAIKTIQSTFQDLNAEIGLALMPTVERMTIAFRDSLNDIHDPTTELGTAWNELTGTIKAFADTFESVFGRIDAGKVLTSILDVVQMLINGFSQIIYIGGDVADIVGKIFSGDWQGASRQASTFFNRYNEFVAGLYDKADRSAAAAAARAAARGFGPMMGAGGTLEFLQSMGFGGAASGTTGTGASSGATGTKKAVETTAQRFAKVQAVIKKAQASIARAERSYAAERFRIQQTYEQNVLQLQTEATRRQLELVNQSKARITDAFREASRIGLTDLFDKKTTTELETTVRQLTSRLSVSITRETEKTAFGSVETIIKGLQDRLNASRQLLENASQLASEGFSQTFIEEVISAGTETGNALAGAILGATPATRAQLKSLYDQLETVSETGAKALADDLFNSFGLATRGLRDQSALVAQELKDSLDEQNKALASSLAAAGMAFGLAIRDIKDTFLTDLDQFDGWFAGLGSTIDQLLGKMGQLSGKALQDTQKALTAATSGTVLAGASITADVAVAQLKNAQGIVVDSMADVAGTAAYLEARIAAANRFAANIADPRQAASALASAAQFANELASLRGAAAAGSAAGTVININVKTDTTQSQAMVGKTIGNIVTKYVTTGGQVLVSGNQ
jgi:hypothetical protein